jgi:hypothetical protein
MLQSYHDPVNISRVLNRHPQLRDLVVEDTLLLGSATLKTNESRRLAQMIHDVRGGALQSLLIRWKCSSWPSIQVRHFQPSFSYSATT